MPSQQFNPIQSARGQLPGKEILPSGTPRKFITFTFFIFLIAVFFQAGLSYGYKANINREIKKTEKDIEELQFQISADQQDDIIKFFSQISNTKTILNNHIISSNAFPLLEGSAHNKVSYLDMKMSVTNRQIELKGVTESYDTLVSQLAIYETIPEIKNVKLERSQREGDIVSFTVVITVDEKVFKF